MRVAAALLVALALASGARGDDLRCEICGDVDPTSSFDLPEYGPPPQTPNEPPPVPSAREILLLVTGILGPLDPTSRNPPHEVLCIGNEGVGVGPHCPSPAPP